MKSGSVIFVHREVPAAWAWMPYVLQRIHNFCEKYDTETAPDDAVALVRAWFAAGDPHLGLWIAVRDGILVGHIFATPEPIGAARLRYVLVRQAEVDAGIDLREEAKVVFANIEDWTRRLGLSKMIMVTHRDADAMARRWGWRQYKAMMYKEIKGED